MTIRLRRWRSILWGAFAAFSLGTATAHEFWALPQRFELAPGEPASLSLWVGQDFVGERVGIAPALIQRARLYTAGGSRDLAPTLRAGPAIGEWPVALQGRGMQLVAIDTHPSSIELPAAKFNEYLELEGLTQVLQQRKARGELDRPGRERYRRNIKTLFRSGVGADPIYLRRTGQRLEIVPLQDPTRSRGRSLSFRIYFDQAPLAGTLVKFWHRSPKGLVAESARTAPDGKVSFTPALSGTWMASVVHMVPATGTKEFDWDSYWGNLTFATGP